jgi:predicted O-methyltransferase YrrM
MQMYHPVLPLTAEAVVNAPLAHAANVECQNKIVIADKNQDANFAKLFYGSPFTSLLFICAFINYYITLYYLKYYNNLLLIIMNSIYRPTKDISINKESFRVNSNEYTKIDHPDYTNLHILDQLGFHERIISLLTELSKLYGQKVNLNMSDVSHGGFIPIKSSPAFHQIYINNNPTHANNILHNITTHLTNKNIFYNSYTCDTNDLYNIHFDQPDSNIIISLNPSQLNTYHKYELSNLSTPWTPQPTLYLYVSPKINHLFTQHFKYYLKDNLLDYDNLIHFCVMVKNGGLQFEDMLTKNMSIIDRWTILDTGSTDTTVEMIHNTLVGTKLGELYEEPFVNFKVSRNRCLDLAGKSCKFSIMLDDTYIIDGNLRNFLNIVRGDQYSDSFTLYICSDDTKYGSNRIIKSDSNLRYIYRIHEVITDKNNINIVIPENMAKIIDRRFDYMEKRTMDRKQLDLKLLYEEVEEDKMNPRNYYYLAQTYNLLEDYEKAYEFFLKRAEFTNSGFIQERIDAIFEAARIANFKLNKPWDEFMNLYELAYKCDESRPDAIYFIGINHYLKGDQKIAYEFFKKGFEIGFPGHCQYSLKPTISFHFLPKFLTRLCYTFQNYKLGEEVSKLFLQHNTNDADDYNEILSYHLIFKKLNEYKGNKQISKSPYSKPLFVFVADGGFNTWSGSTILTSGVGGSETYIIEMARYIQQQGTFQVIVFSNCSTHENFEGVEYKHLTLFPTFINKTYVEHCTISRYAEYLPLAYNGYAENVYLVLHDLEPSINFIHLHPKLKQIFCLSEWHVSYFIERFPSCKHITTHFYYGIDFNTFQNINQISKIPYKFIYSSFPNRGLLPLLQMWPEIYKINTNATLHIYSDVNGTWVNQVDPLHMIEIRRLLDLYKHMNLFYYGWVDKKTLSDAWLSSDIWLYPCIFKETFCLTALEAALTNTLVITNDLAALQNTVSDRGVVIPGNPLDSQWQKITLEKIQDYFSTYNKSSDFYKKIIHTNYQWASTLSWKNQANLFLNKFILPNKFHYKNMFGWYFDLPSGLHSKDIFISVLQQFYTLYAQKKTIVNVLEIGTYTGMSLIHILQYIPNAIGYAVDSWKNYNETSCGNTAHMLNNIDHLYIENSFLHNISMANLQNKIFGIKGHSHDILTDMLINKQLFDFIYIDGSHSSINTYTDCYLAWKLLNTDGIMAIDDYTYNLTDQYIPILKIKDDNQLHHTPYYGINEFLSKHKNEYRLIHSSYRIFIQKI